MSLSFKARPLREEEQEYFQGNLDSLMGEINTAKRDNGRLKWLYCAFSTLVGAAGLAAFVCLLPYLQKRVENHWIVVDPNAEQGVREVAGAKAAADIYGTNARNNIHWAKAYSELVENYVPATDAAHFATVQLLSSPDQRERYVDWHNNKPFAPRQALGRRGSVATDAYHFFPVAVHEDGHHLTEYHITFTRTETSEGSSKQAEQWEADIQFQWWPEIVMTDAQLADNPGGMQVI